MSVTQSEKSQSRPSSSEHSSRRKKAKKTDEAGGVAEALNRLENISHAINTKVEDEFYLFGLNVASKLRQLPLYEALDAQTAILQLLTMARRRNMFPNTSSCTQNNARSSSNIEPAIYCIPHASHTQHEGPSASNSQSISFSTFPVSQNLDEMDLLSEAWTLAKI